MSEIFGQIPMDHDRLKKYGENRAKEIMVGGQVSTRQLGRELLDCLGRLEGCRRRLTHWENGNRELPPGAEWLLDNGYLAQREGRGAVEAFSARGTIRNSPGGAVVMCCARGAIFGVPQLEEGRLSIYLEGFQSVLPLTQRELSLLVPALTAALIQQLDTLCGDGTPIIEKRVQGEHFALIFGGLRNGSVGEWGEFLEQHSLVSRLLRQDPGEIYPQMDEATRRQYQGALCRLAARQGRDEVEVAREILHTAQQESGERRHVGYHLFSAPDRRHWQYYCGTLTLATALLTLLAAVMLRSGLVAFLLAFPIFELVKNCVDFSAVRLVPPRHISALALEEGIPTEGRTLSVVAALLTGEDSGAKLAGLLEGYYLANRDSGGEHRMGILADLPDSPTPMGEQEQSWISTTKTAIETLNQKYGENFYLFFRQPSYAKIDKTYRGWERKRGALLALSRLLLGKETDLKAVVGQRGWLTQVRYVITLDSDTALAVGSVRELVGGMLHPLNRPVLDEKMGIVTAGYGMLQPRVSVGLVSANKTLFSRIFGGQGGIDPYGSTASEVYHDLFDSGSYTGKGIFDVKLFHRCLDGRFPENQILSHDLLEGSYLRCGLMSRVELTDGFPNGVSGYFLRLHRWVRGDWQLLPWIFPRVQGKENPMPPLCRWKLMDNLRRSLTPAFTLIGLVLGLCYSDLVFALAGGVAVLAAASNLLLSGVELVVGRGTSTHVRYHSTIIAGLAGTILQTLLQLIFLPYQACISLSAALTAVYRMAFSKKNRLQWVTAAQTEGKKGTLSYYYKSQWSALAVGLVTLLWANIRFGWLIGLVWMLSPALSWWLSRPIPSKDGITAEEGAFLLGQAEKIWGYFDRFLTEDDHFLPPDNWQEQPSVGIAHRTSPTNIGMAMLSILSAVDLELIPQNRGEWLMERMIESVEQLEKWRGHLYNWYDTQTAKPLSPRYVSTVDSGNFCGCLIALRTALLEWNRPDLAVRAGNLADDMKFAPLFDEKRKLFAIGWEEEQGRLTQGWYDLMASEARQTSFIAVARGEVDGHHWRRLGRMQVGENDYRGLASWTGTMFEYFMPNLLLPWEENSLMYEALCFCVYAQGCRGREMGTPWGISESGFYAFDPAMNYQYKAHGVQTLGLKRGLNDQRVIAPYATFLALLIAPKFGIENLKNLQKMGAEGVFGLYEAVDFTPSRLEGEADFALVRSYMSHHLGMSLVAIDNVLKENIMQRRFMADSQMSAYRELLQERVPVGVPIFRLYHREREEVGQIHRPSPLQRSGEGASRLTPHCHLLSSGGYHVLCCDNGLTQSHLGEQAITRGIFGRWYVPSGISAVFVGGDKSLSFTDAPLYQRDVTHSWEFHGSGASWHSSRGDLTAHTHLTVPAGENGEVRRFTLQWRGEGRLEGELLLYLEPILAKQQDFDAHPAFSKLFLEGIPMENGVSFRRKPRGREQAPVLSVLWAGENITYTTARESGLGRGGLRRILTRSSAPLDCASGGQTDPCLMLRLPISLESGEEQSVVLALSVSDHLESALEGARALMAGQGGENSRLSALSHQLHLGEGEVMGAMSLLRQLVAQDDNHHCPQSDLWQYGVSGDLPIALCTVEGAEDGGKFCAQHQLLSRSGYPFDLVLVVREGGDYRQPITTALREALKALGCESVLGAKGGIHIIGGGESVFHRWGAVPLPLEELTPKLEGNPPPPVSLKGENIPWNYDKGNHFTMELDGNLPPVGWSQILCNPHFGWITDETGAGYLWAGNSREGRLTPWENDPLAVGGEEQIVLRLMEGEHSIFADGDGYPCRVTYGFGTATWEKKIGGETLKTIAFVPHDSNRRILIISWTGGLAALIHRQGEGESHSATIARNRSVILETLELEDNLVTREVKTHIPEIKETENWWKSRVCPLEITCPDEGLNHYLNGWGLYQVLACRLFGRTSQYQNGGAYGFRDQLQDVCALLYTAPEETKAQLLRAGSRQFEEGDVQHWWHPPLGAGVRTRISDDLLWLPYTLARYVAVTGDRAICGEILPYLTAPLLGQGEQERYEVPGISSKVDSLYNHACKAIECFLNRGVGAHGLPLMGAGDWNDGMNRVGAAGRGESLWLGWFGALTLQQFAPLCDQMGDHSLGENYRKKAAQLIAACEENWDGDWYRRGYFDDGTPLGAKGSDQCEIDSLAQSFATFVAGSDPNRAKQGVQSALHRLYLEEAGIIKLFTPPFTGHGRDPGYIRGYLPGVRENGGQYTHGAVWLAQACLRLGDGDRGFDLLRALLPGNHPQQIYRGEPYVLAADVYATENHLGRAGWTWYTGAAGWYYRTAIENLLGIQIEGNLLHIRPNLPKNWAGYTANWQFDDNKSLKIEVKRTGRPEILLDGVPCRHGVPLGQLSGAHFLTIEC